MNTEACEHAQLELSVAHDEGLQLDAGVADHVTSCDVCTSFETGLRPLDRMVGRGEVDQAPDIVPAVMSAVARPKTPWWSVAAVALVGVAAGALVGGVGRFDVVEAAELDGLFQTASPAVMALTGEMIVVERGWHHQVPERVYTGSIEYAAPERLAIELIDTTEYPAAGWIPNDVSVHIADGAAVTRAAPRCPVAALPDCQKPATTTGLVEQRPFGEGVITPLEMVGPGRSLALWNGLQVLGTQELGGRAAIQVEATVAGVDLIGAITARGGWRELHPTDRVLMWLDRQTLVPVRVEVFATDTPERNLWQLRHGYQDEDTTEPILIIEIGNLAFETPQVEVEPPADASSGGFVDSGSVTTLVPELDGFAPHRQGRWALHDGGLVDVASWSDGRSWIMVEQTADWHLRRLFGFNTPFASPIDLGEGSIGYLAPSGQAVGIHASGLDLVLSGSVDTDTLVTAARTLDIAGKPVPADWEQASSVSVDDMPSGTLVPATAGWSMLGADTSDGVTILLTGAGSRSVTITQIEGDRLDAPTGPDFSEVSVRGTNGRYDAARGLLEWLEDGRVVALRSEAVGLDELLALAESMAAN